MCVRVVNVFASKMRRKRTIELDIYLQSISPSSGVSAASRKELDYIEKQRAGSIGCIDHEIRKIKTELYNGSIRASEMTYLDRQQHSLPNSPPQSASPKNLASSGEKRRVVKTKTRINTKDAAEMEKMRLVYMVEQIKLIPLCGKEADDSSNDG